MTQFDQTVFFLTYHRFGLVFPSKVDRNHPQPVKVTMAGNKEKVAQAKAIVTELMTYYRSSVTHPNAIHIEMNVPTALYNYIIGARGAEIKHIQVCPLPCLEMPSLPLHRLTSRHSNPSTHTTRRLHYSMPHASCLAPHRATSRWQCTSRTWTL